MLGIYGTAKADPPSTFTVTDVTLYIGSRITATTGIFPAIMVTISLVTVLTFYPSYIGTAFLTYRFFAPRGFNIFHVY